MLESGAMATILLIGEDAALLEGVAQTLASHGHTSSVAVSLADARDLAQRTPPLVAVVDRRLLSGDESLGLPLAAGGAAVLYRTSGTSSGVLPNGLSRSVLADLTLPLERNRLVALVQRVEDRAVTVGRGPRRNTPPETPALR